MIRYAITAMNKHGLRINIFINKKTYPTLKGVRRAMLTYADNFSPDADLRYEEVEVETELEIAQKQLSQKDAQIKILREALEVLRDGFDNGLSVHTMHSIATRTLAEIDKMKGV